MLLFSPNVQATDAEARFRQYYVNVVAMSLPSVEDQHCDNSQAMLVFNVGPQCCTNIGTQPYTDVGPNIGTQHWYNIGPQRCS